MTLRQVLLDSYEAAVANRLWVLLGSAALPVVGTIAARIGKAGRTDADGRFIASAVMSIALGAFVIEVMALFVARSAMQASILGADAILLLAPLLCLAGSAVGIRWVFPLLELAAVRSFIDVGLFVLACAGVVWLFGKFRGWGLVFFGSISEMLAIGALGIALLRRLYGRAFGGADSRASSASTSSAS